MTDQNDASDRLARAEKEVAAVRRAFSDLSRRARQIIKDNKARRDEGMIDSLRRRLGI